MSQATPNRRKEGPSRRTFSVQDQLLGKLGQQGYGRLLDSLYRTARGDKRGRRKPNRKPGA